MTHLNQFWELPFRIFWKQLQINKLKRTIHSQRKDNDLTPTLLRREDAMLPERYQITRAGEYFLTFASEVGNNERILIFATQ